jgi:putative DNA primase/helicase
MAAQDNPVHPVHEYLESLTWDGIPRLDHWTADYLGAQQNEYSACIGRYLPLAMVARVYKPGCMMRSVVILEGEQQVGKSSALRVLGAPWFGDTPFLVGKRTPYKRFAAFGSTKLPKWIRFLAPKPPE